MIIDSKIECRYGAIFGGLVEFAGGSSAEPLTVLGGAPSQGLWVRTLAADNNRITYNRLYLAAAAASGEAGRFFTTVEAAGAVGVHGIHASVSVGAAGTVAGQAAAVRATFHVPSAVLGGTLGALYAEYWADGVASNVSNGQFIRCVLGGNATGIALLNASVAILSLEGVTIGTAGAGNIVDAISGDKAVTHLGKIRINGALYYLMLRNAV